MLQGIEGTYVRHFEGITEALPHLVTHCRSGLVGLLAAQRAAAAASARGASASKPLFSLWRVEAPAVQQSVVIATELAIAITEGVQPCLSRRLCNEWDCIAPVFFPSTLMPWICTMGE